MFRSSLKFATAATTFYASKMKDVSTPLTPDQKLPDLTGVSFGSVFAPKRVDCDWTEKDGWADPVMMDFGPLTLPIQSGGIHYALQCFEGTKAYYSASDDTYRLFRPDMNAARMNKAMTRLVFPNFDEQEWVKTLAKCVSANKTFIPKTEGYTLYLRPAAVATNENLRVGPADKVKLFYIASPVGPYYPNGFKPVKLIVDSLHKRAWPGGSGDRKIGANYAATISHQVNHAKDGFQQVLWLGPKGEINEVGAMNFMIMWKNADGERELVTPELDGTILPGIARDSVLKLAQGWGEFKVSERTINITEVEAALKEGRVEELFGCGTAAIITAVEGLRVGDVDYKVPCMHKDSIALRILDELSDIQYGRKKHEWSVIVD